MPRLQSIDPITVTGKGRVLLHPVQGRQGMTPDRLRPMPNSPMVPADHLGFRTAQGKGVRPARTAPDSELGERLREGDTAALEILMERYPSRVYRLAFGITRNAADAEEVVQDVFLTLFQKIHTFEGRAALSTWIYRVTTNTALMKRRRQRTDREVSMETLLPTFRRDGSRAGDPAFVRADWSQTPEAELLSQETRTMLAMAIDALPDPYRAVLVLRDIECLSNEEAAKVVGSSVPAVKSRLHRARLALRERLTSHFGTKRAPQRPRSQAASLEASLETRLAGR